MKTIFALLFAMTVNALAQVLPDPANPDCFNSAVLSALARIRSASAEVDDVVKDIEQIKYKCWVFEKTEGRAETTTQGNHGVIGWPGGSGRFPDGTCKTPDTNLVHEIYHCWERAKNNGRENCKREVETKRASDGLKVLMKRCEIPATEFENRYRKIVGLCERASYDDDIIPGGPQQSCADVSCPAPLSSCPDACCRVFGGIKEWSTEGDPAGHWVWKVCVIPHSSKAQCDDLNNRGGQYNAGWYPGANCSEGPEPICSGLK